MKYFMLGLILLFQTHDPIQRDLERQISAMIEQCDHWQYRLNNDIKKLGNAQNQVPFDQAYVNQVIGAISYDQQRLHFYMGRVLSLQDKIKQLQYVKSRKIQRR